MRVQKLKMISEIITGYSFRKSIPKNDNSSVFVLQSKNLNENIEIDQSSLTNINNENYNTSAFVQSGDVILTAKGTFRAAVIKSNKQILAASSVNIVRIKDKFVFPEYLALYLNSPKGQSYLLQAATGALIKNISLKNLTDVPISIPDLETQKKLVNLYVNNLLIGKMLKKKARLIENLVSDIINFL